jgi:hypothetical protein
MNTKEIFILVLTIAVLAVAGVAIFGGKTKTLAGTKKISPAPSAAVSHPQPPAEIPVMETRPEIQPAQKEVQPVAGPQKNIVQIPPSAPAGQTEPLQDPVARDALSFVGADPDAEAYWLDAIYDTSLPDKEREDLMEDLNEDGLSDPKHPGPQDIPLILNRIALIEQIAPTADPFMQEPLGEAYKDLNDMLAGNPVQ